jgi:IS5 family transposase
VPSFRAFLIAYSKTVPFRMEIRERNRIKGGFGHGKEHCGLSRVRYKGEESSEVWVRASLLAMNLKTALKRA